MAPNKQPTPENRSDAIRIALAGLASGVPSESILSKLGALAEEILELASDAVEESGATPADPIDGEGIRERFLADYPFSGKTQHYKSK